MQENPDSNANTGKADGPSDKRDPLFYIVPPLIVAALLLFVWNTKSPSAKPEDKDKVAAAAEPAPAKTEQPAPVETAATDVEQGADAGAVAYETLDDAGDGEQDVPSLLDDDAVGEEIEEIPADTSDDEEEEEEDDADDTPGDDEPAEE